MAINPRMRGAIMLLLTARVGSRRAMEEIGVNKTLSDQGMLPEETPH